MDYFLLGADAATLVIPGRKVDQAPVNRQVPPAAVRGAFVANAEGFRAPRGPFSGGWLQGFEKRRSIAWRRKHEEVGSVKIAREEMESIRQTLAGYSPKDIFNADETGLFWKLVPDRSLSTCPLPGRKKVKPD